MSLLDEGTAERPPASEPNSGGAQSHERAAAAAVTADPVTADLLRRYQAGEKLSSKENGVVGSIKKKLKAVGAGLANPFGKTPDPVRASAPLSPATSDGGLPVVPPDPDLVRSTTASIIDSINQIGARKFVSAAKAVRADSATVAKMAGAKVYGEDRRTVIVNTSPQALEAMGLTDGRYFALTVFWGNVALGAFDAWQLLDELKEIETRNKPKAPEPAPAPESSSPHVQPTVLPDPTRPPGAPPVVT